MEPCFLILNNLKQGQREVKGFAQPPTVHQKSLAWKPQVSIFPAYENSESENPAGAHRILSSPNGVRQEEGTTHTYTLTYAHTHMHEHTHTAHMPQNGYRVVLPKFSIKMAKFTDGKISTAFQLLPV